MELYIEYIIVVILLIIGLPYAFYCHNCKNKGTVNKIDSFDKLED